VGQNTVELWTLESGGGWIHPVHIHLVVRIPACCTSCCARLLPLTACSAALQDSQASQGVLSCSLQHVVC
jgi:hypothetical protein